jgi:pilus assembly protein CpaC
LRLLVACMSTMATGAFAQAAFPVATTPSVTSNMIETQRLPSGRTNGAARAARAGVEVGSRRLMAVGDVSTIVLPNVARIAIGNGKIVKATVVDDHQIVLLAESPGETSMHVWLKSGRQISYTVQVQAMRYEQLLADLTGYLKDTPSLNARVVGERIVIEGRYPDTETATKVKVLMASFPQVLNLVSTKPADADPLQLERMVQLDLRVVEVKKRALDQLGIRWANVATGPTIATNSLFYSNTPWRPANTAGFPLVNTTHPIASYIGLATQLTSALTLLEQNGDAWTLAEPRLSCRSGGDAKFLSGGEIPIPVAQGNGAIGVEYKKYGVVVEFKPVADAYGNIESGITVEVSEPDPRNTNLGFVAFTSSRAETQVALKQGEPLVIAGLLRQKVDKSSDALPGLGRIPVLGYMFGAKEARTEQTELFLVVNPRVVTPDSALNKAAIDRGQELRQATEQKLGERIEPAPAPAH